MSESNSDNKWSFKSNIDRKKIIKGIKKAETATIKHTHKFLIKRWENVREVQSKVAFWILLMGLLIASTGFQMMWFQKSYLTKTPSDNSSYAEAVIGPVETMNPILASSSAEQSVGYLVFSSLLKYDTSGNLNYDLANNVSVDESGKVYTINIKSGVLWHDGENLTAEDVAFTINLIKDPDTNARISGWTNVSVEVVDKTTLKLSLLSTYAPFKHLLTFPILPKHILKDVEPGQIREANFSQNPIGSGPFRFRFIQKVDDSGVQKIIYLARNEDYYRSNIDLSKIQLNVYSSVSEIKDALSKNIINATSELSSIDIKDIDTDRYNTIVSSVQSGVYAIINTKRSILGDVNLRKALRFATDIESIVAELPEGTKSLDLPFLDGQLFGDDIPTVPKFSLEEASSLLDNAGWALNDDGTRSKDGAKLELSVVTMKSGEFERVLEVLSSQWRKVGISIKTKVLDTAELTQNVVQTVLQPRDFDVLIYRLEIGADPDVYVYWNSTQATMNGFNFSNYSNIISDDALTSARSRTEKDIRNAKYITFAKQWINDVPAIGLYQSTMQYVYGKNVKTFDSSNKLVSPINRYADIYDWSVGEETVYKTP